MHQSLTMVHRSQAKRNNLTIAAGSTVEFDLVPNQDGVLPTEHPHDLPALLSVAAFTAENMTDRVLRRYLTFYSITPPQGRALERRQLQINALKREIGCTIS
ncbi:hypothetical protein BDV98DRAFT_122406 [Pterulicium gracile]|uniref:Mug135-like C-terminal domain-containing protein n=1 Tax=Pterulicium gracile TaxID=1884261 RepID=A0A5C3QG43_9AGAR|nr:hypothetical protein BDV98DRAFT_122406 [Pterula gracilis]